MVTRILQLDDGTAEYDVPYGGDGLISIGGALAAFNGLDTKLEARARMLREIEADVARQRKLTTEIAKIGANISAVVQAIENQRIPQPHLEALAVVAIGCLWAGRRVKTRYGHLASSILLGISTSGSGKGSAFAFATECAIARAGLREPGDPVRAEQIIPSTFASVQAVNKAIGDHSHDGLCVMFAGEEIGKNLGGCFGERVSPSKREVGEVLLELVPMSAGKPYSRQASISGGGGEVMRIDSPAVTVYGTTTEIALRRMIASDAAEDGLLGRTIALRGVDKSDPTATGDFAASLSPTVKVLRRRASEAHAVWQSGIGPGRLIPEPMPVAYGAGVAEQLQELRVEYGWQRNFEPDPSLKTVYARAVEKIERVAMCLAVVDNPLEPVITGQCVVAAAMLVEASNACLQESLGDARMVADTERGTPYAKCLAAIEDILRRSNGQWVNRSDITTKARAFGKPMREMALDELLEGGLAEEATQTTGGRRAVVYRWSGG